MHGKKGKYREKFINQAKSASVLIIEGTRTAKEDISESEEIVFENCRRTAEIAKGLIIADFSARNFERLETFQKIAQKVGQKAKQAQPEVCIFFLLTFQKPNERQKIPRLIKTAKWLFGGG